MPRDSEPMTQGQIGNMPRDSEPRKTRPLGAPRPGFDVVATVGHVTIGDGDQTAMQAAFLLIADDVADLPRITRQYRFDPTGGKDFIEVEVRIP